MMFMYAFILSILMGLAPHRSAAECDVPFPQFVGDGYCDNGPYNTAACNYDNGDCCEETCVDAQYACGYTAFNCTDPALNTVAPSLAPPTVSPTHEGCNVTNPQFIGDGFCDTSEVYNTEACLWDGGDCCESTCRDGLPNTCGGNGYSCHLDTRAPSALPTLAPTSVCQAPDPALVGDGFCDPGPEYNNALCDWDGGDCCSQTCTSTPNPCGTNGYFCLQPEYSNAPTRFPTATPTTATPTLAPTLAPTTSTRQPTNTAAPTTSAPTTLRPSATPSTASPTARCVEDCPGRSLVSVTFNSDGTEMFFVFSGDTDQGEGAVVSYLFDCQLLTIFDGNLASSCYWASPAVLVARLTGALAVGAAAGVRGGVLRRECSADIDCASRQYSTESILSVQAPSDPMTPVVVFRSLSNMINECDSIRLDASASTGSGTAGWLSAEWAVSGPGVTDEDIMLNELEGYGTALASRVFVSNAGFSLGTIRIGLTLTNAMGGRANASVEVLITDQIMPALSISGPASRTFFVNDRVTVQSHSFVPECLRAHIGALTYTWAVLDTSRTPVAIQSTSNVPSRFSAPAFTFDVGSYILVAFSAPDNGIQATYETTVVIKSQGAVAAVRGGSSQTKSALSTFLVDASISRHPSFPQTAQLFFAWTCVLAGGGDCGLGPLPSSAALTFVSGQITSATEAYVFTVVVTSDKDAISSVATVRITVVDFELPGARINEVEKKYNPQSAVTVGSVLGPLDGSSHVEARWTVSPAVASGGMTTGGEMVLDGVLPTIQDFPVSFSANVLSAGVTYTLTLQTSFTGSDYNGADSVTIRMNVPPYNGVLAVSPPSGTSLTTDFTIATKNFVIASDSLPAVYTTTAAVGDGGSPIELGRSGASFVVSFLPAGLVTFDHVVTCFAFVTDSYGSVSPTVTASAVVTPAGDVTEVSEVVDELIDGAEATQDYDLLAQTLGVGASSLNAADCEAAPDCVARNRFPCSTTPGTCGACLDGYVGIDGFSNEPCEIVARRRLQDAPGCTIETTTAQNTSCHKQCPNDCSGTGTCVAYGFTGLELEYCAAGDINCQVKCECSEDSYGRACDLTESEYIAALRTRESICFSFFQSLAFQDVSLEVVSSRVVLTSLILLDSAQISTYALTNCTHVVTSTVESYPDLVATGEVLPLAIEALSLALESKGVMSADLLNSTVAAVNKLVQNSQQASSADADPVEVITQNIRLSSSVQTVEGINGGGITLTLPTTLFEAGFNTPTAYVVLSNNDLPESGNGTYGLSIVQYTNNPGGAISNSSVVSVQSSYNATDPSANTVLNFTAVLQNTVPIYYAEDSGTTVAIRCDLSANSQPYNVVANCSGQLHDALCPGNEIANLVYVCPHFNEFPVCNNYESDGDLTQATCTLKSYTETTTTCSCSLSLRTLTIGDKASVENIGTGFLVVADNFLFTWNSITVLSADDVTKNALIFAIVVGLVCALIGGLIFFGYRDVDNVAEKHRRQQEVSLSVREFFDKVIPKQFEESPWPVRFLKVLSERHSYLCFLFPLAEDDYRTTQWLILIGKLINYTFVGTLLTVFFFGDDGTCERRNSKSDCLALKSVDFKTSVCGWNEEHEYCEYVAPAETFLTLIILALAINVLCVPLDVIVYWGVAQYKALLTYYSEKRIVELSLEEKAALAADPEANNQAAVVSAMHELRTCPSRRATFIRAARLAKMQQQVDNLEVNAEVAILVSYEESTSRQSAVANVALDLLADYVTPTKRDFKSVVTRKAAVSRHLLRQNVTGKNAFDGRAAILKSGGKPGNSNNVSSAPDRNDSERENDDSTDGGGGEVETAEGVRSKLDNLSYQQLLRRNVKVARARASKIKRRMALLGTDERKEIYLVRKFLVDNMIGVRHLVANRFFFGTFNDEFAYTRKNLTFLKVVCFLFPVYLAVVCLYIFLYGVTLGSRATNLWIISVGISYLQDIALLETCSIYMVNVVLVSIVYKDLKLLSNRLRRRAKAILNRVDGQMSLAKCYLQHLNAACRAARGYPYLGVSRLLISLNDFDMPKAFVPRYHKPQSKWYFIISGLLLVKNFFVLMYLSIPDSFQDAIIETLVACALNLLFIAVYLGTVVSGDDAAIAGIFVFFLIMIIIMLPWTKAIRSYLWNLVFPKRDGEGKYEVDDDEADEEDDEEEFENVVLRDSQEDDDEYYGEDDHGDDEEYGFELEVSDDSRHSEI